MAYSKNVKTGLLLLGVGLRAQQKQTIKLIARNKKNEESIQTAAADYSRSNDGGPYARDKTSVLPSVVRAPYRCVVNSGGIYSFKGSK